MRVGAGGDPTKLPGLRQHTSTGAQVSGSGPVEPIVFVDNYSPLEPGDDTPVDKGETERFDDLVAWVRRHGRVRESAARLAVLTRTAGVSVEELAAAQNVDPQTLRQRRLRVERRVRQSLSLAP